MTPTNPFLRIPDFAQYYTADEVVDLFAPTKERIDAVSQWLHDAGHHSFGLSANKQWIELDMPVSKLEELLKTKYHHYDHPRTGKATIACDQYHVPAHVQEHVDYITPGLNLMAGGKHNSQSSKDKRAFRSAADKSFAGPIGGTPLSHFEALLLQQNQTRDCDNLITPGCIAGMYNITKATKKHAGNELGIFEEGDFYAPEDLAQFFALLAPNIPVTTEPILHGVDGGSAPGIVATGESDLDFQISYVSPGEVLTNILLTPAGTPSSIRSRASFSRRMMSSMPPAWKGKAASSTRSLMPLMGHTVLLRLSVRRATQTSIRRILIQILQVSRARACAAACQ